MKSKPTKHRWLQFGNTVVIDPRQRTVGIGFFRNGQLVDCHMKSFKRDGTVLTRARHRIIPYLIELLDMYKPYCVLVPDPSGGPGVRPRAGAGRLIIKAVSKAARKREVPVMTVSREDVRQWLLPNGERVEDPREINQEVSRRFPELAIMEPEPRRASMPEQYFTPLFNVAAMYIAWVRKLSNMPRT